MMATASLKPGNFRPYAHHMSLASFRGLAGSVTGSRAKNRSRRAEKESSNPQKVSQADSGEGSQVGSLRGSHFSTPSPFLWRGCRNCNHVINHPCLEHHTRPSRALPCGFVRGSGSAISCRSSGRRRCPLRRCVALRGEGLVCMWGVAPTCVDQVYITVFRVVLPR